MELLIYGLILSFSMGMAAKKLGLPPLIGYLGAGFVFAGSDLFSLPESSMTALEKMSHYGVLLLLFSVGLKLKFSKLARKEVIGTSVGHFVVSSFIYALALRYLLGVEWQLAILVSCALSFSSTVLAAKTLESKQELKSFHGQLAIGVLVIQDLIAMGLMSSQSGELPSIYALGVFALPFIRPILYWLLDQAGHDDLVLVFGLILAIVAGGYGFEHLGLSGELGALVMGALIANHSKAAELSEKLWGLKEVFLVCFFLSIGMKGLPTMADFEFALITTALLPIQALVFFMLLLSFNLKAKSAFLTSTSLTNFSEFALIVSAAVIPEWTIPLALAVSLSFLVSAPINRFAHPIYDYLEPYLIRFERSSEHPDEEQHDIGRPSVLVVGLGSIGQAAYAKISKTLDVVGVDSDQDLVSQLSEDGLHAYYADAEHQSFWKSVDMSDLKYCVLALGCEEATRTAAMKLRKYGFNGMLYAHTDHSEFAMKLCDLGVDEARNGQEEAGESLAAKVEAHFNDSTLINYSRAS